MDWTYHNPTDTEHAGHLSGDTAGAAARAKGAVDRFIGHVGKVTNSDSPSSLRKPPPSSGKKDDDTEAPCFHAKVSSLVEASTRMFPPVDMWDEVEWCFRMLSLALDELGGCSGGLYRIDRRALINHTNKRDGRDMLERDKLASCVIMRLPTLLKTLLLLETDGVEARDRIFKMSIIRRILLCPESIGDWVMAMLQKKGIPSRRAVDYLLMISSLTLEDLFGSWHTTILEE